MISQRDFDLHFPEGLEKLSACGFFFLTPAVFTHILSCSLKEVEGQGLSTECTCQQQASRH